MQFPVGRFHFGALAKNRHEAGPDQLRNARPCCGILNLRAITLDEYAVSVNAAVCRYTRGR